MDISYEDYNSSNMEFGNQQAFVHKNTLVIIESDPDGVTQYTCIECSEKFDAKTDVEHHLLVHNKEYKFVCDICGRGLKRKEHLERHTLEHTEFRPFQCTICGKAFKRKEHLTIHNTIHSGDKSQTCGLCYKSFYRKDHLQKHLKTHNKQFVEHNIFPLSDHELNEIKQELDENENQTDEDEQNIFEGEFFEDDEDKNEEVVQPVVPTTFIDPNKPFECDICHKCYRRKDHLKIHSWTHREKEQICSECGKAFHRKEQLLIHMNTHLMPHFMDTIDEDGNILQIESAAAPRPVRVGPEARPHACPVCRRMFKRKQHVKQHMHVHAGPSPTQTPVSIWCSHCGEGFYTNDAFKKHDCHAAGSAPALTKENQLPTDNPVEVPSLFEVKHEAQWTDESEVPVPVRVFMCHYCNKTFRRKDHYKIHLHIHTGIKSFFCNMCGKGFYRKDHMQKHMLVHIKNPVLKKKQLPDLYPIKSVAAPKREVKPEITIHAPSNTKLRVPLQIKVPYQMVTCLDNGEQQAVTIDPTAAPNES